jgi:hypothetical protein
MIDSSQHISVSSIGILDAMKESTACFVGSPDITLNKKGPPKWLIESMPSNTIDPTVGDEVRSLGKEFIEALDAYWPEEVLEQINYESFVHHIEMAVYEWSQNDETLIVNDSNCQYPDNYWIKLRDIVSGLSGDGSLINPNWFNGC